MVICVPAEGPVPDRPDRPNRLDKFAAQAFGLTRSRIQRLIDEGRVLVNGMRAKPGARLHPGDEVEFNAPAPAEDGALMAEDLSIEVLFSDEDIAVVNKPAGMVVYPAAGHAGGTLMNALAHRFARLAQVGGPLRPGVVHRLDKDTSGIMVVALSDRAYYGLLPQFKDRSIGRVYLALVSGRVHGEAGEIDAAIGRSASDRKKMSTRTRRGKEARTRWEVVERLGGATLVRARLGTGRTHQIRVHLASIGHPVLGDRTYGRKAALEAGGVRVVFPRQMLHAAHLSFSHPVSGGRMAFDAPLPEDMELAIRELRAVS